jgi:hypothetical protein
MVNTRNRNTTTTNNNSRDHASSNVPDHSTYHNKYDTDHFQPATRPPTRIIAASEGQALRIPEDQATDFLVDADDWLKFIEKKLQVIQCGNQERVLLASHQLEGPAADWWDAYEDAHEEPDNINWNEFKAAFMRHADRMSLSSRLTLQSHQRRVLGRISD